MIFGKNEMVMIFGKNFWAGVKNEGVLPLFDLKRKDK